VIESYEPGDSAAVEKFESWATHLRQANLFSELVGALDWDRVRELYDDHFNQTDYRDLGAPAVVGGQAFVDHMEQTFAPVTDLQATLDVIAVDGNRRVGRVAYRGHN